MSAMYYKALTPIIIGVIIVSLVLTLIFIRNNRISDQLQNTIQIQNPVLPDKEIFAPPSPGSIFLDDHTWTATLSAQKKRILVATGDIIPARSVNFGVVARHKSPLWPYQKVVDTFRAKKSDIVFINLESPLIKNCPLTNYGMIFCGDDSNVEGLKYIGVSIANLANNHLGNYGIAGIKSTKDILTKANILYTGTGEEMFIKVRGLRFAFLGFNDIAGGGDNIAWAEEKLIQQQIIDAKSKVDIVVVAFHWGTEYKSQPDQRQIDLAHLSIDSGADLIIGNHPHWVQPVETYKGKFITYAHGNFVFDQMWSAKTREGVVGWYTFYDDKLIDVEFLPLQIDDYGQPHFFDGDKKKEILANMKTESINLLKKGYEKEKIKISK